VTEAMAEPESLGEAAYRLLKADIAGCRLAPGQRVTERQLAAETGLGISAIRDALTRLDHDGLIRTLPRKGYQVAPLTMKSVDDLYVFWEICGPEVARRGVEGATDEQMDRVRMHFEELHRLLSETEPSHERNRQAIEYVDAAFDTLATATRNNYLIGAFHQVHTELSRVWSLILAWDRADSGHVTAENANWADVLTRRDGCAAADIARRYIEASHNRCLRALARWPSVVTAEVVPLAIDERHTNNPAQRSR
jgi:DNA-binding GntR family transcriptional regulator